MSYGCIIYFNLDFKSSSFLFKNKCLFRYTYVIVGAYCRIFSRDKNDLRKSISTVISIAIYGCSRYAFLTLFVTVIDRPTIKLD